MHVDARIALRARRLAAPHSTSSTSHLSHGRYGVTLHTRMMHTCTHPWPGDTCRLVPMGHCAFLRAGSI
eukprot:603966-Prymnesium_polylepis.1